MTDTKNNSKKPATLESLSEQIGQGFGIVKKGFDKVGEDLAVLKTDVTELKKDITEVKLGQEDIKLRLDQAVWRFEFDNLDKRVKVLEDKAGVVREKR